MAIGGGDSGGGYSGGISLYMNLGRLYTELYTCTYIYSVYIYITTYLYKKGIRAHVRMYI